MAFLENMLTNNAHATAAMQPQLTPAISDHSLGRIDGGLGPAAGGFPRGYDGFPGGIGGIGGGGFLPQQPNSGGGMMNGIMDTVQTGFDNLDGAMSGAFDTIKNSLQSKYKTQEALVPNDGGNELQKLLGIGYNMPSPFIDNMNMGMGNAQLQQPIHQGNARGLLGSGYTGSMDQTPPGGVGNAAMPVPLNQGEMAVDATGTQINQDTSTQQTTNLTQEEMINQLYAGLSGQFNGS